MDNSSRINQAIDRIRLAIEQERESLGYPAGKMMVFGAPNRTFNEMLALAIFASPHAAGPLKAFLINHLPPTPPTTAKPRNTRQAHRKTRRAPLITDSLA